MLRAIIVIVVGELSIGDRDAWACESNLVQNSAANNISSKPFLLQ